MSQTPVITCIELIAFEIQLPNLASDPSGLSLHYHPGPGLPQLRFGVRIITDSGLVGEYIPPRGRAKVIMAACEALAYGLIGKPALAREQHYLSMRRATKHIGEVGIGPLDIALWDLAGKYQNVSISQLLGGNRSRLPTYASTLHGDSEKGGLSSPEAYADYAEQCLELGYPAYKVHGWSDGNVARESAVLRTVAQRVGGKMALMYDASCYMRSLADAIAVGRVCDEYGYYWYEDPYADGGISMHGHRKLKEFVKTPLLIGEHIRNPETMTDMLLQGASDFCRVDPDYDGGITGSYKAAIAAEALGMDVEVHSCGPAMRQLMAALTRSNYYELNLVHPRTGNAWNLPVYGAGYSDELEAIDADGCVPVPDGPGLGVSYDWAAVERQQVAKRVISR
ncbi:MAG: mandelate racemase/muconate lactonizing protein [Candidatus Competibacteraceae bacterium]|nr:mandelate racemase/muconate lactonizing protein [Candidatus Competibacteraceae bacterium]